MGGFGDSLGKAPFMSKEIFYILIEFHLKLQLNLDSREDMGHIAARSYQSEMDNKIFG